MQWLALLFSIQAGMISQSMSIDNAYWATPPNTFEVTMEPRFILFDHFAVGGFFRSYQVYYTGASGTGNLPIEFDPFRIDYGFSAFAFYGPLTIGVIHECDHQVSQIGIASPVNSLYGGGGTEVYVRFEGKLGF